MPIYVYRCPACGLEREEIRTMAERDVLPACHGTLMDVRDEPIGGHERETMVRLATSGSFHVGGYSAANNYSRLDTGWQKRRDGIKTRVHGGHVDIEP